MAEIPNTLATNQDFEEIPAVRLPDGSLVMYPAEVRSLTEKQLHFLREISDGEIVWLKYRAVYTLVENALCRYKGCFRPVGRMGDSCDSH